VLRPVRIRVGAWRWALYTSTDNDVCWIEQMKYGKYVPAPGRGLILAYSGRSVFATAVLVVLAVLGTGLIMAADTVRGQLDWHKHPTVASPTPPLGSARCY
jgi:hypothetical protein